MPVDPVSPEDIRLLKQTQERQLYNPYRAGRSGNAATLGHTLNAVAPGVGNAILYSTSKVQDAIDSVDMAGGNMLSRLGVPDSWTASEEKIDLGNLPYGRAGIVPTKHVYVKRMTTPLSRGAAIAGLAALGLYAKKKLLDSPEQGDVKSAATMHLTHKTKTDNVDPHKLAAHVIDKQANLISELHDTATKMASYAAALAQAVKFAQDGLIDVSDIQDHARQLIAAGSVKLSAANEMFDQSPGELRGPESRASEGKLDPLTSFLRTA